MKELSNEDKAKRYDEALVKAAKIHRNYKGRVRAVDIVIEEIFPELKESEGERIRKKICKLLWDNAPYEEAQEYIAWLEKQGDINPTEDELEALRIAAYEPTKNWSEKLQSLYEKLTNCEQDEQKPVIEIKTPEESLGIDSDTYNKIVDECIYGEQKPEGKTAQEAAKEEIIDNRNCVEPKFKVGDWITDGNITIQIEAIKNNCYLYCGDCILYSTKTADKVYHLYTIKDAKDGDVLVNQNGEMPFIFKECKNNHIYCYCGYTNRKDIFFDRFVDSEGEELHWLNLYHEQVYPATKEQRNLLFQKMKEAGYEWDAEKKELKKIEQKPAWSEEDDKILKSIIINIENLQFSEDMREKYHHIPNSNKSYYQIKIDWLKSLKDKVQPKQGLTEEDEKIIKRIKSLLYAINENDFKDIYAWLEFLKNRVLLQSKQEWSKEDEGYYDAIIAKLEVTQEDALLTDNEMDFLKSLEKRYTWKPSDEQMTQLKKYCPDNRPLTLLYEQLKKLVNEK